MGKRVMCGVYGLMQYWSGGFADSLWSEYVEYPSLYRAGQTAVSAKQTADACLLYIPALAATAILSPILFGGMYALGVIVIELQKINTCKFAPAVGFTAGNTPEA